MKWMGLLAVAATIVVHPAGAAFAAPASRDAVRAILRGHEQRSLSAAEWRRLGDDVDLRLVDAAGDPALVFGARQNAIAALAIVGGPQAKAFLERLLTANDAPAPLLSTAVEAYARGFGKDAPQDAQRFAGTVLSHPDWQARRGAARAMGIIGGSGALSALRAQQSRETHPAVRSAIEAALREKTAGR